MVLPAKRLLIVFALLSTLFLWVNRSAYRGFFTDDDLDNLANARDASLADFSKALVSPGFGAQVNFRAAAYSYYFVLTRTAGLRYVPYVAGIQLLHLLNVALVFLLARALGAGTPASCAAALVFFFHAAALDVYWKAMYVFDLLCATFTLLTLLTYIRGQLFWSLLCFWLALKSKELPIFLPLILAAYEAWWGQRRAKRLLPFFAISAVFGLAALLNNAGRDNDYTMRFTLAALSQCAAFYARQMAFLPWGGLAILAALLLAIREPRVRLGLLGFLLLLGPMLFLPGRLFAAYLYAPWLGIALAASAIRLPVVFTALALWIPWNYHQVRPYRNANYASSADRRDWFRSTADFVAQHQDTTRYVFDNPPESLAPWGIRGALRLMLPRNTETQVAPFGSPQAQAIFQSSPFAILTWDPVPRKVAAVASAPDAAYITLDAFAPAWQLLEGWTGFQGAFRWMEPVAKARLSRPAGAREVEVVVYVSEYYIAHAGASRFEVLLDGKSLGSAQLTEAKPTTLRFPFEPERLPAGPVMARVPPPAAILEFRVTPPLRDPNSAGQLGQPIHAFGFR